MGKSNQVRLGNAPNDAALNDAALGDAALGDAALGVDSWIPLDQERLAWATQELGQRDGDLAQIVERWGVPLLGAREPGFATLIHIILEQQVSGASARAAYERLRAIAPELTPARFLALDEETLKQIGFSRQKARYGRNLAQLVVEGGLDLEGLTQCSDAQVRQRLTAVKGLGPWSANIYLLMALRRGDIWPVGDLALAIAVQRLKGLAQRPVGQELEAWGEPWRPWRAVATRILWQFYLNEC